MVRKPPSFQKLVQDVQRALRNASPYSPHNYDLPENTAVDPSVEMEEASSYLRMQRFIRSIILLIPAFFVLYLLRDFLTSILISLIFFAALYPVFKLRFRFLENRQRLRSFLIVIAFTLICLLPILVTLYSFFLASKEISFSFGSSGDATSLNLSPDGIVDTILHSVEENKFLSEWFGKVGISTADAVGALKKSKSFIQSQVLSMANNFLSSLPETLVKILIVLALLYSFLASSEKLGSKLQQSTLFSTEERRRLFESFLTASASTVVGTVLSGLAQATILGVTAWVIRHDNPMLIGALTFLASFFPLIGTASVSLTLIAHSLLVGDVNSTIAFIISGVLAGGADNIILPLVVGQRALVHPLFTLMCALGAIAQFGFFGIFIGPVAGAFAWTALRLAFAKPQPPIVDLSQT